jgi:hypothetical protein
MSRKPKWVVYQAAELSTDATDSAARNGRIAGGESGAGGPDGAPASPATTKAARAADDLIGQEGMGVRPYDGWSARVLGRVA